MSLRSYYKNICRRIQRLPFDSHTLKLLQNKAKDEFAHPDLRIQKYSYTSINIKKYNHVTEILDEFLINENYNGLPNILDLAYKDTQQPWVRILLRQNYLSLKKHWPQRHLVHIFGSTKSIQEYDQNLVSTSMKEDLSFLPKPKIPTKYVQNRIRPIRYHSQPLHVDEEAQSIKSVIEEARKLHSFIDRHKAVLSRYSVKEFDVIYEPTKLGRPGGTIQAHKEFKSTISWVRKFVQMFKPMSKSNLEHLINTATYVMPPTSLNHSKNDEYRINPNFFKYLAKKHIHEMQSTSTLVRAYLRKKPLVPSESTIKTLLRDYARQQFYLDDKTSQYALSWLQNPTERQVPPEMKHQFQKAIEKQRENTEQT